jgi:hypothetical protein
MPNNSKFRNASRVVLAAVVLLSGCAVTLPPPPASNPADAHAAEAATRPLQPSLIATSRSFLSSAAGEREPQAKQIDMTRMKSGETGMQGMSHDSSASPVSADSYYTCPMHPQIKEAQPGNCPICGMTLIKKSAAPEGAKP